MEIIMNSTVLVTGGTGTLGRLVVPMLRDAGCSVRVLSRHTRPSAEGVEYFEADLISGAGVEAAVAGAEIVLHLAGGPKGDDVATRNLVAAAQRHGIKHLVYISVIGADRVPLAWLRTKLASEQTIADSGLPWTAMRAAQFHGLVLDVVAKMAKLPIVPIPGGLRFQPVDARDVAERLAKLTLGEPSGLVADLAGPRIYSMGELIKGYLSATGRRRLTLPVRIPGQAGRAYRAGDNLSLDAVTGQRTWEDFLAAHLRAA
jgi:uncharacterized protein YbjT (DUF2867 family)